MVGQNGQYRQGADAVQGRPVGEAMISRIRGLFSRQFATSTARFNQRRADDTASMLVA
jgi:hypothetical protein